MKTSSALWCVLLAMVLLVSSCKNPKTGNFKLQVKAKYGNQPFAINGINTDDEGRRLQTDRLKFYLSHIKLVKTDNSEVDLSDVILCDFENPASLVLEMKDIKGDFKELKFSCGVDSVQNLTDPLSVPTGHPLSSYNNMYWSWLKYTFESYEGRCDTTTTGSGSFNWFPRYHVGGNAMYRSVTLSKAFSVCCENEFTLNLTLDVRKIFYGGPQTINIITESDTQSGSTDNPVIAPKFADNFSQAFSID